MRRMYEYDRWFAQPYCTLRRGKDYRCSQSSMSQQIHNAAAARGLHVKLRDRDNQLFVRVVGGAREPWLLECLRLGKRRGYLTYAEVIKYLPGSYLETEQLDEFLLFLGVEDIRLRE